MDKEYIKKLLLIENTRMLFDFMQSLSNRCEIEYYIGEGGLHKRYAQVSDLQNEVEKHVYGCIDENNEFLYLNPLSSYLEFYYKLFSTDKKRIIDNHLINSITHCLRYFNIISFLLKEKDNDVHKIIDRHSSLPYIYEDLCLSIKEIMNCFSVYIVYCETGETVKLLSKSGCSCSNRGCNDLGINDLSVLELDKLLIEDQESVIDSVISKIKRKDGLFYVIHFKLESSKDNKRSFEIILRYDRIFDTEFENKYVLFNLMRVLFLRYRLVSVLTDDYAKLIDFNHDCSYLRSINGNTGCLPTVLHITDLHISKSNYAKTVIDEITKCIIKAKNEVNRTIELIAITGDIVDASNNASDAQEKYKIAGKIIESIAINIWGYEDDGNTVLPHDWKKRILIVPGNHDYTTMSDVIVQSESRKIKAAFPAKRSAGVISKLTYYIEFVSRFFDTDVNELIENDMNDVRFYKHLNLNVLLLNTVAKSNSLQNNKVGLSDYDKLNSILTSKQWKTCEAFRIVMMHHRPGYKIDYYDDKYSPWKYKSVLGKWEKENSDYSRLKKVWRKIAKISHTDIKEYLQKSDLLTSLLSLKDNNDKEFIKSEIYSDAMLLESMISSNSEWNEYDYDLIARNCNLAKTEESDQILFDNCCAKILNKNSIIVLAGHEHRTIYNKYIENGIEIEEFAGKKLYDNKGNSYLISFSLLINKGGKYARKEYNYRIYQ